MSTLSLQDLGLRPAVLRAVEEKATRAGKTTPEYVRALVERDLLADQPFDEILRPVREDFRKSGVTEEDLDRVIERARKAAKRPKGGGGGRKRARR